MKRPTKVRIAGRDFEIRYVKDDLNSGNNGYCHHDQGFLSIADDLKPLEEIDTVLHETMHSISNTFDLDLTERQVLVLATVLVGVFQDNPEYAKYISRKIA